MTFTSTMENIARGVEVVGVAVLIAGGLFALVRGAVESVRSGADHARSYRRLRSFLGHSILLGLEVLVAADLIRTVAIDPSLKNVGVLGIIVVIRTFLSFSLDIEIDGEVPWRRASQPTDRAR
ncbi:MAG: DUF1622 domain-containing protein [Acidimicrobiia bacterium]